MDNNEEVNPTVYICFDNNDSSISSFIDFLRATFIRHGIYELDDESDRFSNQIIKVLVVIFSSNYTFYVPENLVNHLNNKDFVVVSVLHRDTESFVTQQIAELERSLALLESAVSPCHIFNDGRSESQFVEEIARYVFEKLYPTEEIGIHMRQVEIENLLCKQPWGLRTLGIFGESGIGKTTLARAFFRRISSRYDASCFIKDFQKEYSERRLEPLSDEYLGETPMEIFDLNHYASKPSNRRKRVLLVLDDVQNAKDAKSFLGSGFGPGSLIIITSRDKQVLEQFHVNEIYELQGLNQKDAMKLFKRCAFGKDVIEHKLLEFSMKVIKCANGNPSTIREQAKMKHASPNEESDEPQVWYDSVLPPPDNVDLVHLIREFINSKSHVIKLVKTTISTINSSYLMCIVVTCVFCWLWNFLGHWESLGFVEQTIVYVVLIYGYLFALFFL